MRAITILPLCALSLAACADSGADADGEIVLRSVDDGEVAGTAIECTSATGVTTPCAGTVPPDYATDVIDASECHVRMTLRRTVATADDAAALLVLDIQFPLDGGPPVATAAQDHGGGVQRARGGELRPVALSRTKLLRNAGFFSVDLDWGTVSGTYDTSDRWDGIRTPHELRCRLDL